MVQHCGDQGSGPSGAASSLINHSYQRSAARDRVLVAETATCVHPAKMRDVGVYSNRGRSAESIQASRERGLESLRGTRCTRLNTGLGFSSAPLTRFYIQGLFDSVTF